MLTLESFEQASEIVKQVTQETKLIKSSYFSELTGNKVYLKPENMQRTGAYKVRGAYYKISTLTEEERAKGFSALELLSLEEENTISDELDEIFSALTDFITVDMNLQEQQAAEELAASKEHLKRRPEKEQRKRRIM